MYKKGEVIVLFKENVTEDEAKRLIDSFGHKICENILWEKTASLHMLVIEVPIGEEILWVIEYEKRNDLVANAELDLKTHFAKIQKIECGC